MKFTFIVGDQVTDVYEASSKDDLVNNFTPDAFKNLVQVPDEAERGMLFDGTNVTVNAIIDERSDELKAEHAALADPARILKVEEKWFDDVVSTQLPDAVKNDATALAAAKADYLKPYQIS